MVINSGKYILLSARDSVLVELRHLISWDEFDLSKKNYVLTIYCLYMNHILFRTFYINCCKFEWLPKIIYRFLLRDKQDFLSK